MLGRTKLSYGSETSDMTSEGLGEMFEGDSADTCASKFPLLLMGAQVEGLACADPGSRTPIGVSGNLVLLIIISTTTKVLMDHIKNLIKHGEL